MNSSQKGVPKIAFVTSHPIQYQVPIFQHLTQDPEIRFEVGYAMLPDAKLQGDGFGVSFNWDIPLLTGYQYRVFRNQSKTPCVTSFNGCDTPEVGDWIRDEDFDVVVVNGWVVKTCIQALYACRKLGVPCIVRGEANHLRPRPLWKKLLQRVLVRRFDGVLPIGTANRAFYKSYGVHHCRMFDCLYCIDNARFYKESDRVRPLRNSLRAKWNIPATATSFLYCGKFENKKHPLELLESFKRLLDQQLTRSPVHLLMVGDGALKSTCMDFVNRHSLPVSFTGFLNQSEIIEAYVASDCFVLPSDAGETWGLVVNEAFACGIPAIVSSLVGCASDLVKPGSTGWVFPFGDWQALAEEMADAANFPERILEMGARCRELIANYSPEAAASGIKTAAMHFKKKG